MLVFQRQLCKGWCLLHFIVTVVIFSYSIISKSGLLKIIHVANEEYNYKLSKLK